MMMEVDQNENDTSTNGISDSSFENSLVSSAKKIKLSKEEMEKIKVEKARLKQEREALKMEREMARLEKEKARVEKEKMKIAKEKQLKEERERKDRLKEEEKEKKEKIRRDKEEEKIRAKKAKEEEKQRKLEEKQALAEEAKKKEELKAKLEQEKLDKSRAVLFNFLKKSNNNESPQKDSLQGSGVADLPESLLMAGFVPPEPLLDAFNEDDFHNCISNQNEPVENLYLNSLLTGKRVPWSGSSSNNNESTTEQMPEIVEVVMPTVKYIYLKFTENIKPPYFGPKPNGPAMITGRNPYAKLDSIDYEHDSDEEWEEGGPGESLSDSDSNAEQEKDDYEIDNQFFVPHGYLSDDEDLEQPDIDDNVKPAKSGPLLKEQTLLAERSRRFTEKLIPQVIGCVWADKFSQTELEKYEFLERFKMIPIPK